MKRPIIDSGIMDNIFVTMFGDWAETIFFYIGKDYIAKQLESPDKYKTDGDKKDLISHILVDKLQLDSIWYE